MTTQTISTYDQGYTLKSAYSYLTITSTGTVGIDSLTLKYNSQSVTNSGQILGSEFFTANGINISSDSGGVVNNNGTIYGLIGKW